MATTEFYKSYSRTSRLQTIETIPTKGMLPSTAPIQEGYCKALVNYDFNTTNTGLRPRAGLCKELAAEYVSDTTLVPSIYLVAAKPYALDNSYTQAINAFDIIGSGEPDDPSSWLYSIQAATLHDGTFVVETAEIGSGASAQEIYFTPVKKIFGEQPIPVGTFAYKDRYFYLGHTTGLTAKSYMVYTMFDETTKKFVQKVVTPKEINPNEAVTWGYNMLSPTPYTFQDSKTTSLSLLGILPYSAEDNTKVVINPRLNQDLLLRAYYTVPSTVDKTYTLKWEYRDTTDNTFTQLKVDTITVTAGTALPASTCAFTMGGEHIQFKLTIQEEGSTTNLRVMVMLLSVSSEKDAGKPMEIYDLNTATTMEYWKERIVLGGLTAHPEELFISDANDPTYFPYPSNNISFDYPILKSVALGDVLYVFTTQALYAVQQDQTGTSFFTNCIQRNLNITAADTDLIHAVKNMLFFKSGNYFYMVVPKANSTTGELTIAPIYKNIEYILNNPNEYIYKLLELVYNNNIDLTNYHLYNYIDYEDIHNVYVYPITVNSKRYYLNVDLVYNSVSRYWRTYVYQTDALLIELTKDATKRGTMLTYATAVGKFYTVSYTKDIATDTLCPVEDTLFRNYQYFDTGYRTIDLNNKKRYREIQLFLNNIAATNLKFYSEFFIDGAARNDMYKYKIETVEKAADGTNIVNVVRELVEPTMISGSTALGENDQDTNAWMLDLSKFPDNEIYKIRVHVSGKGYTPRFVLLTKDEQVYELLNTTVVYRTLYSR